MKLIFNSEISEFISNYHDTCPKRKGLVKCILAFSLNTFIQIWNIRKMIVTRIVLAQITIGVG